MSSPAPPALGVLIVDADPTRRHQLADALSSDPAFAVSEWQDAPGGGARSADVAIVRLGGEADVSAIRRVAPRAVIIALSDDSDDAAGLDALCAGASGYIDAAPSAEAWPRIVRAAARGEAVISRRFSRPLLRQVQRRPGVPRGGAGPR